MLTDKSLSFQLFLFNKIIWHFYFSILSLFNNVTTIIGGEKQATAQCYNDAKFC